MASIVRSTSSSSSKMGRLARREGGEGDAEGGDGDGSSLRDERCLRWKILRRVRLLVNFLELEMDPESETSELNVPARSSE